MLVPPVLTSLPPKPAELRQPSLAPTALWLLDAALVTALYATLGPPIDSYVNGSQTWLTPDGPGEVELAMADLEVKVAG